MRRFATQFLTVIYFLLASFVSWSQDPHFAGVQDMGIWYNPSLKTNKVPAANIRIRSVKYPDIISYSSKAATIELPFIGRDKEVEDNSFFANIAAGISSDKSDDNFMSMSTAMLAFSYALPLNDDNTYLALGFQGNYTFNKIGENGTEYFPKGFDKYGALSAAMANDPFQSGYSFGYFTAGAGTSVFHNGDQRQWYIGASIRHFNKPYTEWDRAERMPASTGIQAGYTTIVTEKDAIGAYGNFVWQSRVNEQLVGLRYSRSFGDSTNNKVSLGLGYRNDDALIPNIDLKLAGNYFSVYYEFALHGLKSGNYRRRAFEISYKINF